uniref:Uncharacterized protein n=1 Tax=Ficedula albicollis TaxID=59894 RepID=A0A803VSH5_FICAL
MIANDVNCAVRCHACLHCSTAQTSGDAEKKGKGGHWRPCFLFSLPLSSAIDGFLKTDERQRLAKERREEREKYLGKLAGGVCIIYIYPY